MNLDRKLKYKENNERNYQEGKPQKLDISEHQTPLATNIANKGYMGKILPHFNYGDVVYMVGYNIC